MPEPIAGRECGTCTICCIEMDIDDPALKKPDKVACPHMVAGQGCGIHAHRPATCRDWYCGWRFLHLSDAMRPDRSRLLLMPELGTAPGYEKGGLRIVVTDGDRATLLQDEMLNLIAKCVIGGVPIFLSWGDGAFAKRGLVNDAVRQAMADGDKKAFVTILRDILDTMAQRVAMDIITARNGRGP